MNTNTINELIARYCSMGVEYAYIGDILGVNRGKRLTKKDLSDSGQFFVYHGSKDTPLGKYHKFNAKGDTVIVVNTGGIGGVAYCKDAFWCSDGSFYLGHSSRMNNKFVYYYLSQYETYFFNHKRIGGVPTIDRSIVEMVKIPVPSLSVQEEIVKILDSYSELEAELETKLGAELDARKKQYEYHLNQLLSFDKNDKDIKFMPLCEACTVKRGIRLIKNDLDSNSQYAVYQNSLKPLGYYNQFNYEGDTTFVISAGAAGDIGYSSVPFWAADDCLCVRATEILNNKYIYYVLKTKQNLLYSKVRKGAVPRLSRKVVEQIIIPIPPLMEQERIVSILDEFNKLTNEISDSLQAEIIARKKQYEYYRNKLLTFKEAV